MFYSRIDLLSESILDITRAPAVSGRFEKRFRQQCRKYVDPLLNPDRKV